MVPIVRSAVPLDTLFQAPFSGQRLVFTESTGALPLTVPPRAASVLALIGPPGGFESSEAERLADGGFTAVSLGPRRLRSETAAIAAVTALQLLWGDLA